MGRSVAAIPTDAPDVASMGDEETGRDRTGTTAGVAATSGWTGETGTAALARAYGDSGYPDVPRGSGSGSTTSEVGSAVSMSFGTRGTSPDG